MKYIETELVDVYNKMNGENISISDIAPILSKMNLVMNRIDLDDNEIIDLIDTLLFFNRNKLLDTINDETLDLLSLILGNASNKLYKEDSFYLIENLKLLLLPFNLNNCLDEALLPSFLASFDMFLNKIVLLNAEDLMILKKYNKELFEVVIRLKYLIEKYADNELLNKLSTLDNMIIYTTLSHLGTVFYFDLASYESMVYNTNLTNMGIREVIKDAMKRNYDVVYVEPHTFACPMCQKYQGYFYSLSGITTEFKGIVDKFLSDVKAASEGTSAPVENTAA